MKPPPRPTNKQIAAYMLYHTSLLGSLEDHLDIHGWEPTEKQQLEIEHFISKMFEPFQNRMLEILKDGRYQKISEYLDHVTQLKGNRYDQI